MHSEWICRNGQQRKVEIRNISEVKWDEERFEREDNKG